jgi:hypothetical protein
MSTRALERIIFIICICLLLSLVPATRVKGDGPMVVNVNTTDDGPDFVINSVCSVGDPTTGPCTLRAAVSEAEGNVPSQDVVINIPGGNYLLTIPPDETNDGNSGDLNIYPSSSSDFTITINGIDTEPAVIDANQLDRVFNIGTVHITLNNIVIRGGYMQVTENLTFGAGIRSYGYLTLDHVVIEENTLDCGPENCAFWAYGGGIYSGGGSLDIIDSTIQNNSSPDSSAIYNTSAALNISYSTVRNNYANRGNVIYNIGALFNIINSTLAGNTSLGTAGIMNYGNLYIASSTFANAGIAASIDHRYGSVTIRDSIFYAAPRLAGISYNCFIYPEDLPWTSLGHNIYSDDSCPADGAGDLINTDPLLGELDWWGGPTMTMPLLSASPAIDHRAGVCLDVTGAPLLDDQRYIPRSDGQCDTGAYEGFIYPVKLFHPLSLSSLPRCNALQKCVAAGSH